MILFCSATNAELLGDVHTNCANEGCHLLFIQCDKCKTAMEGCCSTECTQVIQLTDEEQKNLRKGIKNWE